MASAQPFTRERAAREPLDCGIPVDSQYFDEAGFGPSPAVGGTAVLVHIELPAQYCGVLEYFSQFTDAFANNGAAVETPGLVWQILANRQPVSPYHQMK